MDKDQSSLMAGLEEASRGLLFQSEADYPLEPFLIEDTGEGPITAQRVLEVMGHPPSAPVEEVAPERFFERATKEQEWHNEEERETVRRFRELVERLEESLTGIKVFKVGEVERDVYVVGRTPAGSLGGVKTRVVET
jgi:hypothetical protein